MLCLKTREELLKFAKFLPENQLATGSTGNISARDAETGYIVIKSSGVPYVEMTAEDFTVITLEGEILETKAGSKPSFETPTHLTIYNAFPETKGILHTHIPEAIVLAAFHDVLESHLTPTGRRLLKKPIPVVPFVENGTQEMADIVLDVLKDDSVGMMIRNHGAFMIGSSVEEVYNRTVALRDVCQLYYHMSLLGKPSLVP